MKSEKFDLPGTGYPQLEDIIRLYASADDYVQISYLTSISNIGRSNISRNHDFLIAVGILEGTKLKKRLTVIGRKLGKAIKNETNDEISKQWQNIIGKIEFFRVLKISLLTLSPIKSNKLREKIFEMSGEFSEPYTKRATVSAKTIIDILEKAKYIKLEYRGKDKYYRVLGDVEIQNTPGTSLTIIDLLHPSIIKSSYHHFINGHYRDAILNAFVSVFDLIRERTKLDLDGTSLAQTVFSIHSPRLIVSTIDTESGRNEQIGFMKLLEGAYSSIRNPNAHSLLKKSNKLVTAQYLVFASLLASRIDKSKLPK